MTLSQFRTFVRALVPRATIEVVDNDTLDILINKGVDDVNSLTGAYTGKKLFNVTSEKGEYDCRTDVSTDFVLPGNTGLWWNNGSNWKKLDPYTRKAMDNEFPLWRDDSSGDPRRYFVENNQLVVHPTPSTTLASGFRFDDYIKAAAPMTGEDNYPFTNGAELVYLRTMDDAILDYVRWKLSPMVGKDEKGVISESDYYNTIAVKIGLLKRRPDLSGNPEYRMRGPRIV